MYLKILIQDVLDGIVSTDVGSELSIIFKKAGLNIEPEDDIGDKLLWTDVEGFRYLFVRAYDLTNKNRMYPETQEELDSIAAYIESKDFEVVDQIPTVED